MSQAKNNVNFPMPEITMDRMVLERIRRYVGQCNTEVSGFGFATMHNSKLHIMDARVVKQDAVSGAHTDINKDALNALMYEWRERDGVLLWWHSHVNMDTFWSGQDMTTIKELGKNGMCISMVFNKKHSYRCAVSFKAELPFMSGPSVIVIDEVPVTATLETPKELTDAWDKELEECLPKATAMPANRWSNWQGGQTWNNETGGWEYPGEGSTAQNSFWDDKEFWMTPGEAQADVGWPKDVHWSHTKGAWRKSFAQKQIERNMTQNSILTKPAAKESTTGVGSPSAAQDSLIESRRKYAMNDDDIITYLPIEDEFELLCGIKVDAEWYIQKMEEKAEDDPTGFINGMSEADLQDLFLQTEREKAYAET